MSRRTNDDDERLSNSILIGAPITNDEAAESLIPVFVIFSVLLGISIILGVIFGIVQLLRWMF
jgi:hypothetical protein